MVETIVEPGKISSVYDKEAAIKDSYYCSSCDNKTLQVDSVLTDKARKEKRAYALNDLSEESVNDTFIFYCSNCGNILDSKKIDSNYVKLVKKSKNLTDVAMNCNPYKGQTWSAKSRFPTEICPINKNPCLSELWKVCPHIGNAELNEIMNFNLPIIGEK